MEFGVPQGERLYGFSHTGVSERVRDGDGERGEGKDALMEAGPMIPWLSVPPETVQLCDAHLRPRGVN